MRLLFSMLLVMLLVLIFLDQPQAEDGGFVLEPATDYLRDPSRIDNSNALQKSYDFAFNNCVMINKLWIETDEPMTEFEFFNCMHMQGATL